jgi:two-component system cell cycle sensor histidine kinase/response regulator CckA
MTAISLAAEHPARILVVDDEYNDRQLMELLLAAEGFVVLVAASGEEALTVIAQQSPDLILLDVMMPDMDGYQLAERIKSNGAAAPIPIIMVTVLDDRDAMMRALAAGAQDYLVKPVNRAELYIRVRNLLRLKAYGDNQGKYSRSLEREVGSRQADLVDSEQLYRTTFDAAPIGIVRANMAGQWLHVNQRLCDLLGYSREQLQTVAIQESIQSEEPAVQSEALVMMATSEIDRHVIEEQRYRRSDGTFVWVRVVVSVRRDADGEAQEIISVIEDITDRRVLEERVQESVARLTASEQRYRALLENANDAIAVLTPQGVVREMNQRWAEIVGVPREQLIGRHVSDFATSDNEAAAAANYEGGVASNGSRSDAVKIATGTGSHLLLEFSRSSIEVAGERLVLTIGRDVTEQRQLEERLRQAQKLEVIGQLAGGVAHDFNNILTAIIGFCELLLMDMPADSALRSDVIQIKAAGERAAGLTRQLLAFSRKQILHATVLNINGVIQAMEPMMRRLIAAHVDLVLSLQLDVATIKIDATQLEQIVINLLVNAADAMPRGGKVTIETANIYLDEHYQRHHLPVKPGDYVMLAVSDTGSGMDNATIQRIFEPFFTTKEVGKGTGLGLATVYGIVKQSGGDIWVYSEPSHGSVFKIYLPRVSTMASAAVKHVPISESVRPGSETILLVEDDVAVRQLARLVLERTGYRVMEAGNPKEALAVASQDGRVIDLLLSDLIMPDSDGPPLFDRLAKAHPGVRVLYMSGYADEAVVRHGVIVEGTPFLQKPFTPQTLSGKVRDVLDAPRAP